MATISIKAANFAKWLDGQNFTAMAQGVREAKISPRKAAAYLLDEKSYLLREYEVRKLNQIAGRK